MISKKTGERKIWGVPEYIPTDEELFDQLVDGLFFTRELHLLAGPSGVGKSRFTIEMLERIRDGESIFGHASRPTPFVYYLGDRGYTSGLRLLLKMGIKNPRSWPLFSPRENKKEFKDKELSTIIKNYVLPQFPDAKLVFVEGLGMALGDKADYNSTSIFLQNLHDIAAAKNITIIGSVHTAKYKEGESYELSRENILGSVAWGAICDTVMLFHAKDRKNHKDPRRYIEITAHEMGNNEVLNLSFRNPSNGVEDGHLHLTVDPKLEKQKDDSVRATLFAKFIKTTTEFISADLNDFFEKNGHSKSSAEAALRDAKKDGLVFATKHGAYKVRERTAFDLTNPEDDIDLPAFRRRELEELQGLS